MTVSGCFHPYGFNTERAAHRSPLLRPLYWRATSHSILMAVGLHSRQFAQSWMACGIAVKVPPDSLRPLWRWRLRGLIESPPVHG